MIPRGAAQAVQRAAGRRAALTCQMRPCHTLRAQSRARDQCAPRDPPHRRPFVIDKRFFPRQVVESSGNRWDWALLPLVLSVLVLLAYGGAQMARPYEVGDALPLTLDPLVLPYYLMRTTLRMFIAMGCSLVFA